VKIDPITGLKRCPCCGQDKNPDDFWRSKVRSDGLDTRCKDCKKVWREDNYVHYIILASRNRAKLEGVPCTIDETDIYIPEICPISSCRRFLERKRGRAWSGSPSLDRYNPTLGYIPGNVWVICNKCNRDKQNMTGEQHIAFGTEIINAFKEECERVAQLQSSR